MKSHKSNKHNKRNIGEISENGILHRVIKISSTFFFSRNILFETYVVILHKQWREPWKIFNHKQFRSFHRVRTIISSQRANSRQSVPALSAAPMRTLGL